MQIFLNPIFRNNDYIVHQRPNYSLNSSVSYLGNTKFMTKNEILIILPFSVWLEDWWTIRMWSTLCEFCSRRDSLPWTKWLKRHRPALPLLLLLTLRLLHTTNLGSLCQDRVDSLLHWFVVCYFFPSNNSIENSCLVAEKWKLRKFWIFWLIREHIRFSFCSSYIA